MRTHYKPWAKPFIAEHREIAPETIDLSDPFFLATKMHLEIGMGKGDFVVEMAIRHPADHYVAIEVSPMVSAMAIRKMVERDIGNVRVLIEEAEKVIPLFKDATFDSIYLNFSDPWPKRRHEKRRLTFPSKLVEYMRMLKVGGIIYFKTDDDDLYHYSLETFLASSLEVMDYTDDYAHLDADDAYTEYETIFRGEGKNINRIVARRKQI